MGDLGQIGRRLIVGGAALLVAGVLLKGNTDTEQQFAGT